MDTPPYSDVSLQLSPSANALHVNGDHPPNAVGHPNGAPQPGPNSGIGGSDAGTVDFRALYSSSWSALDTQSPPTLREILTAYKQKGDGDREMLLAMLNAKSAEDQRIASQLSLRRSMLEINKSTTESRSQSHPQLQYPQASHSQGHGHMYTYVPDESYALSGPNHHHRQQHHAVSASPPAPHHTYASGYSSHSQSSRSHAHLRAVESPPLSSTTQKSVLSAARVRPVSLSSSQPRGSVRLPDMRSQVHAVPQPPPQIPSHSQRRKRPRLSRSRSRSPGPIATSPPHRGYAYTYTHSAPHSHAHSELEAERSPYSSASDSGSPRSVPNAYVPRTMAIGSLLSAAKAGNSAPSSATISNSRANGRLKDDHLERADREQDLEAEKEQDSLPRERKRDREEER